MKSKYRILEYYVYDTVYYVIQKRCLLFFWFNLYHSDTWSITPTKLFDTFEKAERRVLYFIKRDKEKQNKKPYVVRYY